MILKFLTLHKKVRKQKKNSKIRQIQVNLEMEEVQMILQVV